MPRAAIPLRIARIGRAAWHGENEERAAHSRAQDAPQDGAPLSDMHSSQDDLRRKYIPPNRSDIARRSQTCYG